MRPPSSRRRSGFTLTEMLVVIVIIAALSSLAFMVASRAMKKAEMAKSISNMRQIGVMMGTYAAENHNRLPPPRADIPKSNGGYAQLHWFETLIQLGYPSLEQSDWRNIEWWENNQPVLRNPLIEKATGLGKINWWNPGYAINRQIVNNIDPEDVGNSWTPGENGPQAYAVPLSRVPEPARTPIVVPRKQWHYTFTPAEIKEPAFQNFLIDGKMAVLFIDGHVESMIPEDYTERKLHEMPRSR